MQHDFLLEIGTEELPPKAMPKLAQALLSGIEQGLSAAGLSYQSAHWLAAPRRLAIIVTELMAEQPEQKIERRGPAVNTAYDKEGQPTKALQGFAASCGVELSALEKISTDKGEWFYYQATKAGQETISLLPNIVTVAIKQMPIPKPMRWGNSDIEFIRPVHWIVMLFGKHIVEAEILGKKADHFTYGHRFLSPNRLKIHQPDEYVSVLAEEGLVLVDFAARRAQVEQTINALAHGKNAVVVSNQDLLDEVTAIVEWPVALLASFDRKFLAVPKEALISAMHGHQKSFPLVGTDGALLPYFIFVANLQSKDAAQVIAGNEKVMRARLSDAKFFYETDIKVQLDTHLPALKNVVFQEKLGTMYDRTLRVTRLATFIAEKLAADVKLAERAALLAKCDLLTNMVGEFPELQGIMGKYYAEREGEDEAVCAAILQHYRPMFAGDQLPEDDIAISVALADKLDLLVGIFAIGQKPTGDKDPFGLRRAAIGVVRILVEKQLDLDIKVVIAKALAAHKEAKPAVAAEVYAYLLERLKYHYVEQSVSVNLFNAINELQLAKLADFELRLKAVQHFLSLAAASSLAEANKRVKNILTKQNALDRDDNVTEALLQEAAEKNLYQAIITKRNKITPLLQQQDYNAVLSSLAELQQPVDQFFTDVMVMTEDVALRNNRLLLLNQLRNLFLTVADISQLS